MTAAGPALPPPAMAQACRRPACPTPSRRHHGSARWWLAAGLGLAVGAGAQAACGDRLPAGPRLLAQAQGWTVAFQPRPAPLSSATPLALDLEVCAPVGSPAPARIVVDADMPAHKHGMNYRPSVRALGDGRYQAEGLLLHMPGRWRFLFDLHLASGQVLRAERLADVP